MHKIWYTKIYTKFDTQKFLQKNKFCTKIYTKFDTQILYKNWYKIWYTKIYTKFDTQKFTQNLIHEIWYTKMYTKFDTQILYRNLFKIWYTKIYTKFDTQNLIHKNLYKNLIHKFCTKIYQAWESHENQPSDGHISRMGVNEFLSSFFTFILRFSLNSEYEFSGKMYQASMNLLKICPLTVILHILA